MLERVQSILDELQPVLAEMARERSDALGLDYTAYARAARNYNRIERAVFALEDVLSAGPDGRTA